MFRKPLTSREHYDTYVLYLVSGQDDQGATLMLVLSRRVQERIVVGEQVEFVVLRVEGERVIVGIEAPREVKIRRAELPRNFESRRPLECIPR
jgi:carbon storage regulator CsrA